MRQFQFRVGYENFALIHVSLVPDMHGEQKTKPTQTTVHALRGLGLLPDLVGQLDLSISPVSPFSLDCLPSHRAQASRASDQVENLNVLSCRFGTSYRRARRLFRLPRPPPPPISRHHSILAKAVEPWKPSADQGDDRQRSSFGKPLEGAYRQVNSRHFSYSSNSNNN